IKKSSFCYYSSSAAAAAAEKVNLFANAEGLKAHGESMLRRAKKERI
ncbi:MAG: histidinol dehydrogenase, partial [Oscillospiraceae bacterium]|nr:histidinol dehydrogenase [Oscillospiraceae bacterium]